MNKIILSTLLNLFIVQFCYAQFKFKGTYGIAATASKFNVLVDKQLPDIKLIGGNLFYESPPNGEELDFRIEYTWSGNSTTEDIYQNFKFLYGARINEGNRFQIPAFLGLGINLTDNSDLNIFGFALKMGTQYYIGKKWGIFGEFGWDAILSDFETQQNDAILGASNVSFNVGFIFTNF